ncbi:unnamed protein product [Prunus armeniaca]
MIDEYEGRTLREMPRRLLDSSPTSTESFVRSAMILKCIVLFRTAGCQSSPKASSHFQLLSYVTLMPRASFNVTLMPWESFDVILMPWASFD